MSIESSNEEYYRSIVENILVPVKVSYHDCSDIVYSFDAPTLENVEKALKENTSEKNLERIKDLVVDAHRTLTYAKCDVVPRHMIKAYIDSATNNLNAIGQLLKVII